MNVLIRVISRWYVAAAVWAATVGFVLMFFLTAIEDSHSSERDLTYIAEGRVNDYFCTLLPGARKHWTMTADREVSDKWQRLMGLMFAQKLVERFPRYVLMPGMLVGFSGFSLDLLCKRLRKHRQGAA